MTRFPLGISRQVAGRKLVITNLGQLPLLDHIITLTFNKLLLFNTTGVLSIVEIVIVSQKFPDYF